MTNDVQVRHDIENDAHTIVVRIAGQVVAFARDGVLSAAERSIYTQMSERGLRYYIPDIQRRI